MTDHKKYCHVCQGVGQVDTGIDESPITICNQCNGTGLKAQRKWVGLTPDEMLQCNLDKKGIMVSREQAKRNVEARLKEKNT